MLLARDAICTRLSVCLSNELCWTHAVAVKKVRAQETSEDRAMLTWRRELRPDNCAVVWPEPIKNQFWPGQLLGRQGCPVSLCNGEVQAQVCAGFGKTLQLL